MSKNISITLTDAEYELAVNKAAELGLDLAQYVKRYPIGENEFNERYAYLIAQAKSQPIGTPFTVMSLFPDWGDIPKGIRLSLGRCFYHLVKRKPSDIKAAGKNSSNIQMYVREKEELKK